MLNGLSLTCAKKYAASLDTRSYMLFSLLLLTCPYVMKRGLSIKLSKPEDLNLCFEHRHLLHSHPTE